MYSAHARAPPAITIAAAPTQLGHANNDATTATSAITAASTSRKNRMLPKLLRFMGMYQHVPLHELALGQGLPDAPALTDLSTGTTVTYRELRTLANNVSRVLAHAITSPSPVIAVQLPNSVEFAAVILGIAQAGAASSLIGPLLRNHEARHLAELAGADPQFGIIRMEQAQALIRGTTPAGGPRRDAADHTPAVSAANAQELAFVPYSSGTTGMQKAVGLTGASVSANMTQFAAAIARSGVGTHTPTMSPLPFSHIYGLTALLLTPLMLGHHVLTMQRFDPERFVSAHRDFAVQLTFIAPPLARVLETAPADAFNALELIISGADRLDPTVARTVESRLGASVIQGYGMTETSPVTFVGVRGETPPDSVGFPLPDTRFRIGSDGELSVAGPQLMRGYLGQEPIGEWFQTGDLARVGTHGELYIIGRAKDTIKYKGYQIAPAELEATLLEHEAIVDAAVTPFVLNGTEVPRAFVVPAPSPSATSARLTADGVMRFVADRVAPYKKVRVVDFVEEIPRSAAGKILRTQLRDLPHAD
ncbi:hypothetical protein CIG21_02030 [Corynebacterium hadale]|uniref:Acyl-CoA synthetase n=2 Tax=Corynebacteriaceae TaxID=1653 RepID=A0A269PFU2_9CORY|nr:hypothetical protein CIG21_02030 [Corynebacterium hadale]